VTVSLAATDNVGGSGVKEIDYVAVGQQNVPGTTVSGASTSLNISAEGATILGYSARDNAGNVEPVRTLVVQIDKTRPSTTASVAPLPASGRLRLAITGTIAVRASKTGPTLGTVTPIQCWNSPGVAVTLTARDAVGASGVKQLAYTASGSQTAAGTASGGSSDPVTTTVAINKPGRTILAYSAQDTAANQEASNSLTILVGAGDDGLSFACTLPMPAFTIPPHGTLVVSGTATINSGPPIPFGPKNVNY
jgi:hypothetical protein